MGSIIGHKPSHARRMLTSPQLGPGAAMACAGIRASIGLLAIPFCAFACNRIERSGLGSASHLVQNVVYRALHSALVSRDAWIAFLTQTQKRCKVWRHANARD